MTPPGRPVLLPRPLELRWEEGEARLADGAALRLEMPPPEAARLRRALRSLPLHLVEGDGPAALRLRLVPGSHPSEGYALRVGPGGIEAEAGDAEGLIWALATLRQLLPPAASRRRPAQDVPWTLPACTIRDAPRFAWRGALIDVARHFFPKHEILRQIDVLGAHKINRLQLHLTDEQGWRVESRRFPRLTEVGASRERTQVSHWSQTPVEFDEVPHGGFYTAEDLREIHDHAADRGIVLVPEIELPGHTGALLAAYPEFGSPRLDRREVLATWGIHDTLLAPTEATFAFLHELLDEVMDILPGPYLHIGADESVPAAWETDPAVQAYARSRGLTGTPALFADLVARVEAMIEARGRTTITWDDAFATRTLAAGGAGAPRTLVMAWRGEAVARRAAAAGHGVIMAPQVPAYLNYDEGNDAAEPLSAGGPLRVEDIASWEPVPRGWSEAEAGRVLGIQLQFWTEFCNSARKMDYMLYPRAAALADLAWTGRPSDPAELRARLAAHLPRLEAMGVEFRPLEGPRPWQRGGRGRERHRPSAPLSEVLRSHEDAAERGETPTEHGVHATGPEG